ncbi:hypothetical protein BDB01DRAFT_836524 [Pilobolus umbonatus]|nr:hypothetical protein BDB01DRAFT_836524 [Pilobolus umbonatus]
MISDNHQNKHTIWIYGLGALAAVLASSGLVYYVLEDDKRVKRRKAARQVEQSTLRLLTGIKKEASRIEEDISTVESELDNKECDDKAFKLREYTIDHSNELLIRSMEKLDAIRPLTLIAGDTNEPTVYERQLVTNVKSNKRKVIEYIEGLFRRIDIAKEVLKKDSEIRAKLAQENARIQKEAQKEAQKKAAEEAQKKAIEEAQEKGAEEAQKKNDEEAQKKMDEEAQKQVVEEINQSVESSDNVNTTIESDVTLVNNDDEVVMIEKGETTVNNDLDRKK